MTDVRTRLQCQAALRFLVGKKVVRAMRSMGTSFFLDFPPIYFRLGRNLQSGRWMRPQLRGKRYLLFEFCDWTLRTKGRMTRTMRLSHAVVDRMVESLTDSVVQEACLMAPEGSVRLRFKTGQTLLVKIEDDADWWIGLPFGRTISPFNISKE